MWAVTVPLQKHLLHVGRGIVEQELGRKVIETGRLWVELEANQSERLAGDLTDRGIRLERACCVLHDRVLHGGITCVVKLDCLVDGLRWATGRESQLAAAHLDHRNERLGTWGK